MSTGTNSASAASSSNGPSNATSGINLNHLSRNQLEKIINMRINAQTCHDLKCKREKEYFQRVISKMANTFTELFAQVEKQRRSLHEVVRLHNKICNEFAIPNKINQNEVDYQKLRSIATMFQDFFAKQAKNAGLEMENITVKQSSPMLANMLKISAGSNELTRKRKFPITGNVSTNAVTLQTSLNNNLTGKRSSIKTPFTLQILTTTPSTSTKMTAANKFATPHQKIVSNVTTPPTVSASAIIYQGKELSFGSNNATSKKPRLLLPKTKINNCCNQLNEIDIIQID